jgi:hypothetical protein
LPSTQLAARLEVEVREKEEARRSNMVVRVCGVGEVGEAESCSGADELRVRGEGAYS